MNDQSRMLINAIRGPIILITIGVLFAADKMTNYHFHQTWPVLLIVIGLMQLIGGRRRGGRDYYPGAAMGNTAPQASPYTNTPAGPSSSPAAVPNDSGEPRP